ncbi:hypothetical protein ElyMa_003401400 [Elysia marginata]|uniref:Uncharacterized protein n=1 Tax=Elysia marginata TaxID=1093978 RepID=A0AAV4JMA1_9GAST|nr:hypothetical protein ElyMa_003401400 [Elysia marginata]
MAEDRTGRGRKNCQSSCNTHKTRQPDQDGAEKFNDTNQSHDLPVKPVFNKKLQLRFKDQLLPTQNFDRTGKYKEERYQTGDNCHQCFIHIRSSNDMDTSYSLPDKVLLSVSYNPVFQDTSAMHYTITGINDMSALLQ